MNAERNTMPENTPEIGYTEELLALDAARLADTAPAELTDRVVAASTGALRLRLVAADQSPRGRRVGTVGPSKPVRLVTPVRIAACVALFGLVGAAFLASRGAGAPEGTLARAETTAGEVMTPGVDPEIDSLFFAAMHPENQDLRDELRSLRADAARLGDRMSSDDEPFLGDDEGSM